MSARVAEADKLMQSAKKKVTKSFPFKMSVSRGDWDNAATDYAKAAQMYATCMPTAPMEKVRGAFLAASEAHDEAGNLYLAAQMLDKLATWMKDNSPSKNPSPELYTTTAQLYQKASVFLAKDQKTQARAEALAKAAKDAQEASAIKEKVSAGDKGVLAEEAVKWLKEAIEALEDENMHHHCRPHYKALFLMQFRSGDFMGAIATHRGLVKGTCRALELGDLAAKACLEIVIICLHLKDEVLAEREFQAMSSDSDGIGYGFSASEEQRIGYDLIEAWKQKDNEKFEQSAKETIIGFLNNDIARIIRKMQVPGGGEKKAEELATPHIQTSGAGGGTQVGPQSADNDSDEDAR